MRQVAWPTRPELINYTTITLFVLVVMIGAAWTLIQTLAPHIR